MLFSKISAAAVAGLAFIDGAAAQNKFPLTGAQTGIVNGQRPPRKEIRELFNDKPSFSLFVLALNAVMAAPENTIKSYFSAAEIHGAPYRAWDGVNPKEMLVDGIPVGYCPHGNVLFGVWHRPYLLLIEQNIVEKAREIAATYNSQQWRVVADKVRLPYWDWALPPVSWPLNILSVENVTITTPSGQKSVSNPFFRYKFQGQPYPADYFPADDPLAQANTTLRSTSRAPTRDDLAAEEIGYVGPSYPGNVWRVFAKTKSFNNMTTFTSWDSPDFETIHGGIHGIVGGHMGPATYTAYDPLFWLHHATVDRQIALWQAIYPNTFVEPAISQSGTWTIYPNTPVNASSPLTPFTQGDRRTPHNANSVRHISALGYSYSDIPSHILSGAALSANVTRRVNQLYNPDGTVTKRNGYKPRRNANLVSRAGKLEDWTLSVAAPADATGHGYTVSFKLNNVNVGSVTVMNALQKVEVQTGVSKITRGEVALAAGLEGVQDIEKSIKAGLSWEVVNDDGSAVPLANVKGLEVVVAVQSVVPAVDDSSFPEFGPKVHKPEVLA